MNISKKNPLKRTLIVCACLAMMGNGQSMTAEGTSVRAVQQVQVQGNVLVDDAAIAQVLQPWQGLASFEPAQLEQIRQAVSDLYKARGLGLSLVQMQDVGGQAVKLLITETRLATVTMENGSNVDLQAHSEALSALEGQAANTDKIERVLAVIKGMPGVSDVQPTLTPGTRPGDTQLHVKVSGQPAQRFEAVLDNHGAQTTGKNRLTLSGDWSSPAGWGDKLNVSVTGTPRPLQSQKDPGGVTSGQLRYDMPVGGDGWRMGVALNKFTYALGDALAGGNFGEGHTASVLANYPLWLSPAAQSHWSMGVDDVRVSDAQLSTATRRSILAPKVGMGGYALHALAGQAAQLNYQVDLKAGRLRYLDEAQAVTNNKESTLGKFAKLNVMVQESVQLLPSVQVSLKANGQLTSKNLDSSERLPLAGLYGVRGYPTGMQSVDQGAVVSAEVKHLVEPLGVTVSAFYDHGQGQINHRPTAASGLNDVKLTSAGLGLNWSLDQKYTVQAYWAKPLTGNTLEAQKSTSGRVWVSVSAAF